MGHTYTRQEYDMTPSGPITTKLLERVEIDGKRIPIYLREEPEKAKRFRRSDLLLLGVPRLTAAVDHFSAMPLGLYLGFNPQESTHSALACLRHAIRRKDYILSPDQAEWWQCKYPWPAYGIPKCVVWDLALAQLSNAIRYSLRRSGITIQRPPRRSPKQKSAVERFLREVQRFCEPYVGFVPDIRTTFSETDPLAEAFLIPKELVRELHQWIVNEYIQRPQEELGWRSPSEVWAEQEKLQRIRTFENPAELDYLFLKHCRRTLDSDGVHCNGHQYASRSLQSILDRHGRTCEVQVGDDVTDLGFVTIFDPKTEEPFRTPAKDFEYANGLSLFRDKQIRAERAHKPGQSNELADWERNKVKRLKKADELRRLGKKRTHVNLAREEAYDTSSLSSANPNLTSLERRNSPGKDAVVPQDSPARLVDRPAWTDDQLPDVESDDG